MSVTANIIASLVAATVIDSGVSVNVASSPTSVTIGKQGQPSVWGSIGGNILDQTDLQAALAAISPEWGSISGTITDQTDLITYLNNGYIPYVGATQSVDLNGFDLTNVNNVVASNSVLAPIFYVGSGSPVGVLEADGSGNFNIGAYGYQNFVGWNATSSTPYFGLDPTVYGYGVSYSSNILYVTSSGGAQVQGFQVDGAQTINGDSSNFVYPFTVNDACSYDDGSTRSFTVYNTGLGREGFSVDNQGSVYMNDAGTYFNYSGGGNLAGGVVWSNTGQLRVGSGTPLYAYLEAIGGSYSHLRMGQNDSIYSSINVDGSGRMTIRPSSNTDGALQVSNAGGTNLFKVDTASDKITAALGANTFLFAKGASNITPNLSIAASGGKAVALVAGTSGTAFVYDNTGTFSIGTDARATIVAGTTSGGTQRIGMTSAGLVKIGAGTAVANLDVEPPSGAVSVRFKGAGQSTLELNDGTSNYIVGIASSVHIRPNGTQIASFKNNGVAISVTTTTPSSLLHVAMDTATMPTIDANTGFILSNASATGDSASASIIAGATGFSVLNFGDTADENVGYIQYAHSTNTMSFGANTNPMLYIDSTAVGVGVAANDKFTVGSAVNGTNITIGLRTLTSGGSSMRSIFTQNASTGALDLVVDQGQNGSARAFNLTVGGATNAISVSSVGAVTIIAGQSLGSSSAKQIFNASTATTVIDYDVNASSTANNTFIRLGNGTLTSASSGVSNIISSTPSINQSGTAGYTAFNINVTETATGSGAKNLAKLAVGGTTMFNVDNAGAVTIGSGSSPIKKIYSATATLDFGSITGGNTAELTITVTGATVGDSVSLSAPAALESGLIFCGFVSAADTVKVRVHNSTGAPVDPVSATWRATVTRF